MPVEPSVERISRAVVVLVAGALAVVLIVGLRYFSGIIAPLFLALVLTIAIHPLRKAITRGRVPGWVEPVLSGHHEERAVTPDVPVVDSESPPWTAPTDRRHPSIQPI